MRPPMVEVHQNKWRENMSLYQGTIKKIAPKCNARYIEAWLRLEFGTLDHLSPSRFRKEVKMAVECAKTATKKENEDLAKSYGL
jgi:hypothetical protein